MVWRVGAGSIAAALMLVGCAGGATAPTTTISVTSGPPATTGESAEPSTPASTTTTSGGSTGTAPTAPPPAGPGRDAAVAAVRAYVSALDRRHGAKVCALLAPGAIDAVALPERRGSCAASLTASIGYRPPHGLPVWDRVRVARIRSADAASDTAKVVATTVTRYADRSYVSTEDDVVYLVRSGDRWLIAKPSSTLYRAVGVADVPPSVLAPPPG